MKLALGMMTSAPWKVLDGAGADANASDLPGIGVDLENVVDVDGPLELEDEAGNEIVDDVLQAKAEADADCAGQDSKLVKLHSAHIHGGEEDE